MNTLLASIREVDHSVFELINQAAGKNIFLDSAGIFFANYFEYVMAFFLCVFLLLNKKHLRMVIEAVFAATFARLGIVGFIRFLYPRFRPFVNNNIHLLIDKVDQASFPSGHASFFFGLATVIYLYSREIEATGKHKYSKKIGILFLVFAFLISISRVFCGVHWPLDVLAGAVVGIFSGWLVFKLSKRFIKSH